jgi:hypothetical protein
VTTSVAGQAGDDSPVTSARTAPHICRDYHTSNHQDAQADSGINILAQLGGDRYGKRRNVVNMSLVLDMLKLLILLLDIVRDEVI